MLTLASKIEPLKARVRQLEEEYADAIMAKTALDRCTSNMMLADADMKIVYVNESLSGFLQEAEHDIQQELPNFNVSTLIGTNVDIFHKNPAHQRGMIDKLKEPYKTSIMVGGRSFNLVANPIFGDNGERLGTVVEWQDGIAVGMVDAINKSQAVIEFAPDGNILNANENFLNVMGYTLEEIIGKHHSLLVNSEYTASNEYQEFWNSLNRGEGQTGEFLRYGKGGKEIWVNASYNPIMDLRGRVVRVVKTATDITHAKLETINASRLKLALDSCTANMMMADDRFNIIYINGALIEFLGEAEEDIKQDLPLFNIQNLIGKNIDIFHKNPAHQRSMIEKLTETYTTSIVVGGRSFNLVATPVFGDNGTRLGTVVEWQDGAATGMVDAITKSQGVIEFTPTGKIVNANENFLGVVGYTLEEVLDKHHSMFCEPQYAASEEYKQFWEDLSKGEAKISEYKRLAKGGKEIWISASYNPVLDLRGRVVRVVKTATDITGEMEQRRVVELLSLVANETDNSVIITDKNECIEYVNPGFTKMSGYTFDEVKGKKPGDILQGPLTDKETKRGIRESLEKGKSSYFEILNYHKNGETYWVSLAINPVTGKDGTVERFISIQANVTETKEQALDASTRMNAIISSNATVEWSIDGEPVSTNAVFAEAVGESKQFAIADQSARFHLSQFVDEKEFSLLKNGKPVQKEVDLTVGNGKKAYFSALIQPVPDTSNNVKCFVMYGTVTTDTVISRIENEHGMNECNDVLQAVASGTLTKRMEREYNGAFSQIKVSLNATIERLYGMVKQIIDAAQSVNSASSEISAGSTDLSQRTEQQASSLEETAASMEQITGTVKQNSENAMTANELSGKANKVASDGGRVVENAVSAMGNIEQSSQKISDIIGVIDEIAFQTNLLALNAAVEAARAGDAGKGFAVVASEVRSLAGRSASASKEIKALINESASEVKTGAELVNKAGETLKEIVSSVEQVSGIVSEIAAASQEQATGIDEINSAITQMDEVTQQNAALVEENTAAATSMVEQARELEKLMSFFTLSEEEGEEQDNTTMPLKTSPSSSKEKEASPSKSTTSKSKSTAKAPTKKAKAAGGNAYDDDWQEF